MIMDEVLAVGDMAFQKKCLTKMREAANKEGRTVLYVSHNMNTIRQLCDRCIVLDKGKVVFDGDVEEAINIYLSTSKAMEIDNYFLQERDKTYSLSDELRLTRISFLEKREPIYYVGEDIKLRAYILSNIDISNIAIRTSILSMDKTVIGMASSMPCINLQTGDNCVDFRLSTNGLAPEKYLMKIVVYEVGSFGKNRNLDVVDEACCFEIIQMGENNEMVWNSKWWGHLMLPTITVL